MTALPQKIAEAVAAIRTQLKGASADTGIIFGTGLSALSAEVQNAVRIPYAEIPHFARSTVESHAGELLFGQLEGRQIVAMKGRFHAYEGWSMAEITFPVRVMKALGAKELIVSNACGGMNPNWRVGDLMVIDDHINLLGLNPLVGPNDEALGPRFPDMSAPYDQGLIALAEEIASEERVRLQKGVYVAVLGPNLETRAEYRMLRAMGADVVGMSTVPEVIVAVHAGLKVLGLSVITDACMPDALEPADIQAIIATATKAEPGLGKIVRGVLRRLAQGS